MTWSTRTTPPELAQRYVDAGWWVDEGLGEYLHARLCEMPEFEFRVWSDVRPWRGTVGDVHEMALRAASGFHALGVRPGDVVSIQIPNWVEAAAVFWGLSILGAVPVPIVHFYGAKEVEFILRESGAVVHVSADHFGHTDFLEQLRAATPNATALREIVVVGEDDGGHRPFRALLAHEPLQGPTHLEPGAPAFVGYTSGTTANPKGVVHSQRSALAEVRIKTVERPWPASDRPNIIGAPVSHATGMLGGLLSPLVWRFPIHFIDRWDPGAVLHAMAEADLTAGSGGPYFLSSLLDHPDCTPDHVRRIRHVAIGGSSVPDALAERATSLGVSIVRGYGSTEHPSTTGAHHEEPEAKRLHTDGRPHPGVEVRVVDDDGHDVPTGDDGEVLSRGPELFEGYTDPELTKAAIDDDGWYATGDVGRLDADGWVTITDRKKDIIVRGGEKVSAVEVEQLLYQLPGVAELAVVAAPDARLGEHGCVFVRVAPGARTPDLDAVRAHLDAAGLARQKWPEELRVVDDFPRTPSGKIKKHVLRDDLRCGAT
ncbi:MAG TPA: AMP-binding protein [Acidimicrobiia bacterium]|nr:AMP-binding protein [Acidimicrobiia bacterium]